MQIDHLQKCAHQPCICQIPSTQEFCSEHCREQANAGSDTCRCGHGDCATEAVPQPA